MNGHFGAFVETVQLSEKAQFWSGSMRKLAAVNYSFNGDTATSTISAYTLYAQSIPRTPDSSTIERILHKAFLLHNPVPALVLRMEGPEAEVSSQVETDVNYPAFSCIGAALYCGKLCSSENSTHTAKFLTLCCFSYLQRCWRGTSHNAQRLFLALSGTWGII